MRSFKSEYPASRIRRFRKAVSVLLAISVTCAAAGCDKNDSLPAEVPSDISSEQNSAPAEFDFDDAVKNITIFGNKISLPCTIRDFGEDFSLNEEGYVAVFDDIATCGILYKGKTIGYVSMIDYTDGDDLKDKQIGAVSFGFIETFSGASETFIEEFYESHNMYYGLIEVDFGGFSFESTEAEVASVFSEPKDVGKKSVYEFDTDNPGNSAEIEFYQGKVKIIHIYLNN